MAGEWGGTPGEHDEIKPRSRVLRGNMLSGVNTELKQGEPEKSTRFTEKFSSF